MTTAALALALALVAAPPPSRCRLERVAPTRRRIPLYVVAVAIAVAMAMMLPVTATLAAAILVGTLVLRRRRLIARRARAAEASALQGALDVLVGELRVGVHPVAAFDVAAREVDGPVATSLRAVAARARLGADVAAGLRNFAESSRLPAHWERLALFWRLAQTHGLTSLSENGFRPGSMPGWPVPAPRRRCWPGFRWSVSALASSSAQTRWASCWRAVPEDGCWWSV